MLAGFQSSKTPAGNVVSPVQFAHALWKSVPAFMLQAPNDTKSVLACQAYWKVVPLDRSRAGKLTMAVLSQAEWKLVPLDKSTSDGKDVIAMQLSHDW